EPGDKFSARQDDLGRNIAVRFGPREHRLDRAARVHKVREVASHWQLWISDDRNVAGDTAQHIRNLGDMRAAGLVIILMNPDAAPTEVGVEINAPLSGTTWVCRSDKPKFGAAIGILFPLHDVDHRIRGRGQQLRQAIGDARSFRRALHPPAVLKVKLWELLLS